MPELKIEGYDEIIRTRRGETVRDALYRAGVELDSPCSGDGVCGKCLIRVMHPGIVAETPHRDITDEQAASGVRLACQVVCCTDMTISLLSAFSVDEYRILEGDRDPDVKPWGGEKRRHYDFKPAGEVNPAVCLSRKGRSCFCQYESDAPAALKPWQKGAAPMGLAVDLGTTTMVATVVDLNSGKEMATTSGLNPQIRFGHDVVRRIQHGSTEAGLQELFACISRGVNDLAEQACEDSDVSPGQILDVVIGGNTAMLQIAAGINPEPLGRVPFAVDLESGRHYPAEVFGLRLHPSAKVYVPPVIHAYVGSDISAGLLVCRGFFREDRTTLFIDIGTNGEIGLSAHGKWLMTSAAAGPAFEGMRISSGMRARIGAIEAVTSDGRSIKVHAIGDVHPTGICGSGIIDAAAVLTKTGVIDLSGRMALPPDARLPGMLAYRLEMLNEKPAFKLSDNVYFTQEDVRQVQLAKSAIRAAIDILLSEAGITAKEIDRIVLAGGFGYSLRPGNLETIGLLPPGTAPRVYFAGNTCRIGCVRMLRSMDNRRFIEKKVKNIRHVAIETRPDFMERYVDAMEFPEIVRGAENAGSMPHMNMNENIRKAL